MVHINFQVCLGQIHIHLSIRFLRDWQNVELLIICPAKRGCYYDGAKVLQRNSLHRHWSFPILMRSVFVYYSRLVYDVCNSLLSCALALTKFGECTVLWFLYKAYCAILRILAKSYFHCCDIFALLLIFLDLLDEISQLRSLSSIQKSRKDAAQSLVVFSHLPSIDWTIFAASDSGKFPWVYYDLEADTLVYLYIAFGNVCNSASGAAVSGETLKVQDGGEDWDLDGIIAVMKAESSSLRRKFWKLQACCCLERI